MIRNLSLDQRHQPEAQQSEYTSIILANQSLSQNVVSGHGSGHVEAGLMPF